MAPACLRLRAFGIRGCIVEEEGPIRVLRAFLPLTTPRERLVHLALLVEEDARGRGDAAPSVTFERVESAVSPHAWQPTAVGRRLLVQPADAAASDNGRLVVRLLPRFGFGTAHETTRLCLEALEDRLGAGETLADIGCGSGVLSIAASRLGAARVDAVDIDPVAADTAEANRALNGIGPDRLGVETGGVEKLKARYDGILCNTFPRVLEEVVPRLAAITREGSWIVASGFRGAEVARMGALFAEHGWTAEAERREGDWHAIEARRGPRGPLPCTG